MAVRRIVAYAGGSELAASREFYVEILGMRVAMEDPVLDLQSPENPTAEAIVGAQEMQDLQPSLGVDVGEPAAVDAAHVVEVKCLTLCCGSSSAAGASAKGRTGPARPRSS